MAYNRSMGSRRKAPVRLSERQINSAPKAPPPQPSYNPSAPGVGGSFAGFNFGGDKSAVLGQNRVGLVDVRTPEMLALEQGAMPMLLALLGQAGSMEGIKGMLGGAGMPPQAAGWGQNPFAQQANNGSNSILDSLLGPQSGFNFLAGGF